ncbi:hypothetical protein [Acinetobacter sp.]|uniref:hypothetical protein n=1 Tax=Acinetobacter sp. TaxID=472 RepID=UPI00388D4292
MNSKNPPINDVSAESTLKGDIQAPQNGAQSLPQEDALQIPDNQGLVDPSDKMKRIEREGEINKVTPQPENTVGPDTTGVGQPVAQAVNQGQSLPQAALPVEKKFEGRSDQFYDPNAAETAEAAKARAARGGQKTDL